MSVYDKYYQTEDLFGQPYPELLAFFENYPTKGHVLDLGCGQGRDSLMLARLGYRVTGVDISGLGIRQMLARTQKENLQVTGIVADLHEFEITEDYDIVLLDSLIHFYKRDRGKEEALLAKIAQNLKIGGLICLCIRYSAKKEQALEQVCKKLFANWEVLNDTMLEYLYEDEASGQRSVTQYRMLILKKTG